MEKILAFQVKEPDLQRIGQIAGNMRIKLLTVEKGDFKQTIGDLLEQKKNSLAQVYEGEQIKESLLVMEGFSDKRLDNLLKALKKEQVIVDYKAIVTPTNRKWTVLQLYLEMEKEKRAYLQMMKEQAEK